MKFRKKPVEVEAFKWYKQYEPTPEWFQGGFDRGDIWYGTSGNVLYIRTLEGVMEAGRDDVIIKGVKGELYPCRLDIFKETYEPVTGYKYDEIDDVICYY